MARGDARRGRGPAIRVRQPLLVLVLDARAHAEQVREGDALARRVVGQRRAVLVDARQAHVDEVLWREIVGDVVVHRLDLSRVEELVQGQGDEELGVACNGVGWVFGQRDFEARVQVAEVSAVRHRVFVAWPVEAHDAREVLRRENLIHGGR